jgi:hypothetical protein
VLNPHAVAGKDEQRFRHGTGIAKDGVRRRAPPAANPQQRRLIENDVDVAPWTVGSYGRFDAGRRV